MTPPLRRLFPQLGLLILGLGPLCRSPAATPAATIDTLVRCTITDAGERQAAPDPDLNPLHYRLITHGYVAFGRNVPGDREPDRERFLQRVVAALRPHGLLPADEAHPPRLVIGVVWGSILGYPETKAEYLRNPYIRMKWRPQIGYAPAYDPAWHGMPVRLKDRVMAVMRDDVYVLSITAYDHGNAARGVEVPFWQTRGIAVVGDAYAGDVLSGLLEAVGSFLRCDEPLPVACRVSASHADVPPEDRLPAPVLRALVAHDHGAERFD